MVFCNADVLIAYVIMPGPALGTFSAAAVLPKAIVTATLPLTQVMLPVVVSIHGRVSERRLATAKAALLALALASACLAVLWGTSDLVCGGPFGIRSCEPQLMLLLGTAAIPLAILRTLVVADLGVGQYRIPHLPALMLAVTVAGGLLLRPDAWQLAIGFAFSAWALLVVTVIAKATTWLRWKP